MIEYAIYFFKDNEKTLTERLDDVVKQNNYDISNRYYSSLEDCYKLNKHKLHGIDKSMSSVIYERDTSITPCEYRLVNKKELVDYPFTISIKFNEERMRE